MEKICKICNVNKQTTEFHKTSNGRGLHGVMGSCKECYNKKEKIKRDSNKEIIKEKRNEFFS